MIYLDNNATTALDPRVFDAMAPHWNGPPGNPSSRHAGGRSARRAIDVACQQIAQAVDCAADEIVFTASATEANNLAIRGAASQSGATVLLSRAEHPSCIEPVLALERAGGKTAWLTINEVGEIQITEGTKYLPVDLAVLQLANGETGCMQDIAALRRQLSNDCPVHCDAVQAIGKRPVLFRDLGVATLSISGHKIHGPAGIAALLVRHGHALRPILFGGHQQRGFRPGTEPVALIAGLGAAVDLAVREMPASAVRMRELRNRFEQHIMRDLPNVVLNGPADDRRLPNCSNLSFLGVKVEPLLIALDLAGVCCSAGAACASGSLEPSPVLRAMGLAGDRLESAVRFSLSKTTTIEEIDQAAQVVCNAVAALRRNARF